MNNPMKNRVKIYLNPIKTSVKKGDQKSSQHQRGCQNWSVYMYGMPPGRAPSKLNIELTILFSFINSVLCQLLVISM